MGLSGMVFSLTVRQRTLQEIGFIASAMRNEAVHMLLRELGCNSTLV